MYSTRLRNDRYLVDCLTVSDKVTIGKFVVDTGAKYTCCNYCVIDSTLEEAQFSDSDIKYIGGFVNGEIVKFYKYPLKQFTVGNIDMEEQSIWLTFDERVTDIILGMDILKQVIIISNPYNQKIYFCKDLKDYNNNFGLNTI